jgi:hypothetical protein
MKNKLMAIAIIGVFVMAGISGLVLAKPDHAGPAEKTTGSIGFTKDDGHYIWVEFNAHEAKSHRPAKGWYHWWNYNPDGTLYRNISVQIQSVNVDGTEAWFDGACTYDSWGGIVGNHLYIHVEDVGTPGTAGDDIGWDWGDTEYNYKTIEDGNIVVHTYS